MSPSSPTEYTPERNENKPAQAHAHERSSSTFHNSQKVETAQVVTSRWRDKQMAHGRPHIGT